MKLVTLELKNDNDIDLLIAFTRRLDGEILNIEEIDKDTSRGPVFWLNELAKKGGIHAIEDPSEWQRNQRVDC